MLRRLFLKDARTRIVTLDPRRDRPDARPDAVAMMGVTNFFAAYAEYESVGLSDLWQRVGLRTARLDTLKARFTSSSGPLPQSSKEPLAQDYEAVCRCGRCTQHGSQA